MKDIDTFHFVERVRNKKKNNYDKMSMPFLIRDNSNNTSCLWLIITPMLLYLFFAILTFILTSETDSKNTIPSVHPRIVF